MDTRSDCVLLGTRGGPLGMLCTIMRPILAAMNGRDFRNFKEAFLRYAAGRRRYFTINRIQMATTWSAFALFLLALGYLEGQQPQDA